MGMLTSSMFGLLSIQNTEDRHLQQKLARSSLKHGILRTLKNDNDCSCQFKGKSLQGINKLDLNFNSACDGWDSLPQVGKNIGANLKVGSVKLQNIRAGQLIEGIDAATGLVDGNQNRREYNGTLVVKFDPLTFSSHRAIHHIEVPLVFTADQRDEIDKCGANQNYVNVINSMSYVIGEEIKILRDKIKDLDDNKVTPNEGDIITNKNNIKSNKDEIPPLQAQSGDNYNEVLTKVNNHSHGLYASTDHSRNPSCPILSCTPCAQ